MEVARIEMDPNPCSLLALPNELLSQSFEHVAIGDGEDAIDSAFDALKLSHISSRLRQIAVRTAALWTSLTHDARLRSMDFVEACLMRSGTSDRNLNISVTLALTKDLHGGVPTIDFLRAVSAHSSRWRSLRVNHTRFFGLFDTGKEMRSWILDGLYDCPGLNMLSVQLLGTEGLATFLSEVHRFWTDALSNTSNPYPSLRQMSLRNVLPLGVGTFQLLSVLDVVLEGHYVGSIAKALQACVSLETFRLSLRLIRNPQENTIHPPPSFPSVKKLEYNVFVNEADTRDITRAFAQLEFENATEIKLHLEYLDAEGEKRPADFFNVEGADTSAVEDEETLEDPDYAEMEFRFFIECIIPKGNYPSLETLSMSFGSQLKNATSRTALVSFPIERLPKLRHLDISSDLSVLPYEFQFIGPVAYVFPALRTIRFRGSRVKMNGWVGRLREALRNQGDWDSFERLTVPAKVSLYDVTPGAAEDEISKEDIGEWVTAC